MIWMLFWISRFSCWSAWAPDTYPRVYSVALVLCVMCVMRVSRIAAPSEIPSCCLFRSLEVRMSQMSGRAFPGNSFECCTWAQIEARAAPTRARRGARVGRPRKAGRPEIGGSRFFPKRCRNFSKRSLEFVQNQFLGAELARGPGHPHNSEIRNFSKRVLEFFQS